jgi:hypothetical protein
MRQPKMTDGPVCLWLSRLLSGVGVYFDFVGMRGLEWEAYVACWSGFPL